MAILVLPSLTGLTIVARKCDQSSRGLIFRKKKSEKSSSTLFCGHLSVWIRVCSDKVFYLDWSADQARQRQSPVCSVVAYSHPVKHHLYLACSANEALAILVPLFLMFCASSSLARCGIQHNVV